MRGEGSCSKITFGSVGGWTKVLPHFSKTTQCAT